MTFGSGFETAIQNDELFKSKKTKKYKPPPIAMPGEQGSTAQQVGRFLDGKAARVKVQHEAGKQTTENVFRVLGQYLKGGRSMYGQKMKDARQAFGLMDKDGGGTVDTQEFGKALKRLGFKLSPKQLQEVLEVVDADGSGEVDYQEFVSMLGMEHETEGQFVAYDPSKARESRADELKAQADNLAPDAARLDQATHNQAAGYHLTDEEKAERQANVLFKVIKQKLASKWSLFGEELDGEVESFFTALDKDGSESLDPEELRVALKRMDLGLTDKQVQEVLVSADADGSGDIDMCEWIARFNNAPVEYNVSKEMKSESTVGSSIATLDAPQAIQPQPPPPRPTPASRLAFEKDMADAMAVLDVEAGRQRQRYGRATVAAEQMRFSAARTRLRPETARAPGVMVSRPWPPPGSAPGSARQPRRWHEGSDVHVESARGTLASANAPPRSPRSTRTVCSARDPRGTGQVKVQPPARPGTGAAADKPIWGVAEWGQSRLFYPGPGGNPSATPPTLPSGAPMYSESYQAQQSKDHAHLEARAISIESGIKGLKKAEFNSQTRFYEARDELIFTKGGLLGSDFGPSSQRLKPWTASGVVPRSSPHFRPGLLPPQPTPWQVHGKEDRYVFEKDLIEKDHPRLDNPRLDYRRDIVDQAQTPRVVKHGSTPRCVHHCTLGYLLSLPHPLAPHFNAVVRAFVPGICVWH